MNSNDKIVYMFTSKQQPYYKDILDILALPFNAVYRFRYRKEWISNEIINDYNYTKLKGKNAIIVFIVNDKNNNSKFEIFEFIPVRKAKIIDSKLIGDFLWVSFILQEYVKYDKKRSYNGSKNEYNDLIKEVSKKDGELIVNKNENLIQGKLLFISDDKINDKIINSRCEEEEVANWYNIITYIASVKVGKEPMFFKINSIKDVQNNKKLNMEKIADLYGFKLKLNKMLCGLTDNLIDQ